MQSAPPRSIQIAVASRLRSKSFRQCFLELSRETEAWLCQQPGFIRHELFETRDGWMDTMFWRDHAAADHGNAAFAKMGIAAGFVEIIEPANTNGHLL